MPNESNQMEANFAETTASVFRNGRSFCFTDPAMNSLNILREVRNHDRSPMNIAENPIIGWVKTVREKNRELNPVRNKVLDGDLDLKE
ncbi:hypothetical protein KEJ17_06855 [Candidatus Bathyarchaeota archaeon]|nr:hypothetical protein [Candidatus Bathyarchaeota archaeon]